MDNRNKIDIFTPNNQTGYKLLGHIVDHFDTLIEEWYPGLGTSNMDLSEISIQRLAPCYSCKEQEEPFYFNLIDCVQDSYESDTIHCPNCGPVFIARVAPDVVFQDLDEEQVIPHGNVEFQDEGDILGSGAFAAVYKAKVNDRAVAVKVI